MLYTNTVLHAEDKKMEWGILHNVTIGEEGRGRKLISLPCPNDVAGIPIGLHPDLTIAQTKTGRPRINHGDDNVMYMILSAEGGYTRRGNGTIQVPSDRKEEFNILVRGNGADGAAGRIGYWDCMVLQAPLTDIAIRVRTSGGGYGRPSDIYIIHDAAVYHCTVENLEDCCDSIGISIPDGFELENGVFVFQPGFWTML